MPVFRNSGVRFINSLQIEFLKRHYLLQ